MGDGAASDDGCGRRSLLTAGVSVMMLMMMTETGLELDLLTFFLLQKWTITSICASKVVPATQTQNVPRAREPRRDPKEASD